MFEKLKEKSLPVIEKSIPVFNTIKNKTITVASQSWEASKSVTKNGLE